MPFSLSVLKGQHKCPIKIFMLLMWEFTFIESMSTVELFIIVQASSGPWRWWWWGGQERSGEWGLGGMGGGVGETCQITSVAPSTTGSVLNRKTSDYGISPLFPNMLTDKNHLTPTLERTFPPLLLCGRTQRADKSLLFQVQSHFQEGNDSEVTMMA